MNPESFDDMLEVQDRHWWHRSRRDVLGDRLSAMNLPASTRIVEIGAGVGGNLELLSRFGRLTAIEASPHAMDILRKHVDPGVALLQGALPDGVPEAGQFDLVCMLDVLEHLDEEQASLTALHALLAPGGRLLVTVPAYQWMWSRHDDLLLHRRRYTKNTLAGALAKAGFAATRMSYFFATVFPLALAARLWDRLSARDGDTGTSVPAAPVNEMLYRLMQAERCVLRAMPLPFGLSLMAEARVAGTASFE